MRRFNRNKAAKVLAARKRLASEQKPLPRWAKAVNWAFAKLPLRVRLVVLRVQQAVRRWWVNPAAPPELIGKRGRHEYRPADIALSFKLHADGAVMQMDRFGHHHEWVTDPHLVGLVHREYKRLVEYGRQTRQIASL